MLFRAIICCTALVLGLLFSLNASSAAPACDGADCPPPAKTKPLNIMQFMREQAASTRVANPSVKIRSQPGAAKQAKHPTAAAATAQRNPSRRPVKTVAAAPAAPQVQVVDDNELNTIDRAAGAAPPPETVGAAIPVENSVRFVDADEFNSIDRKADEGALLAMAAARNSDEAIRSDTPGAPQTKVSWLSWMWSGFANIFVALSVAVHNLIG